MSATLNYPTMRAPTRPAARRRYAGYFIFSLCASLYLLPFMRILLMETDEGELVSGAVRIAHGQVFARDFFEVVGPGTFYWLAIFFKLFGVTFLATRIYLFVSSLGTALLMYFLSRRVCERYQTLPCLLLAATYFGMLWPTISHHVDSNFFALAVVACVVLWQERRNNVLLLAAGVLAAATTFFHQPKGMLLLLALLLWLWIELRRNSASVSSIGILFGGYVSVIGIVLLYFWSRHALWDLFYANVLWPSGHYGPANVVPYAQGIIREYWRSWAGPAGGVNWRAGIATALTIPFVVVAALPVLLPVLGVFRRRSLAKPEIVLYWLCGWALWLAEFHRKDMPHLVFGSPVLMVLCIYYLGEYRRKIAGLALQVLAISAASLAALNIFMVLVAHPIQTRMGAVAVFNNYPALAMLEDKTAPGEDIFVYPFAPEYYFLTATVNPTRYSGLGYNYNSAAEFEGVVRVLDEHRVRYVLWDKTLTDKNLKVAFPSVKLPRPDQLIMEPYLESHYKSVWTDNKGIHLMERKSEYQ